MQSKLKSNGKRWIYIFLISVFSLSGLLLCMVMLNMYSGASGELSAKFFCGQSSIISYGCTGVFLSRYGKFLGLSWPIWGMMYFGGILLWLIIFRRQSFNILFSLWMLAGAITSIALLVILLFVIHGQCRWCILTHICNGLIVITSITYFVRNRDWLIVKGLGEDFIRALLVIFILLSVAGWVGTKIYQRQAKFYARIYENIRTSERFQRALYEAQKAGNITITSDDHILGHQSAKVFIVVYKDFQCPVCYESWTNIKSIFDELNKKYSNQLAIVVRNWPLSNKCNPYLKVNMHPYACWAARAAEAVYQLAGREAFWSYHNLLMKNRDKLDTSPYVKLAQQIGISRKSFLSELTNPEIDEKIKKDIESGQKLKIAGVPAIFINGKYIDVGWKNRNFLRKVIESQLICREQAK